MRLGGPQKIKLEGDHAWEQVEKHCSKVENVTGIWYFPQGIHTTFQCKSLIDFYIFPVQLVVCWFCFVCIWTILSDVEGLFLTLLSGITPSVAQDWTWIGCIQGQPLIHCTVTLTHPAEFYKYKPLCVCVFFFCLNIYCTHSKLYHQNHVDCQFEMEMLS